MPGRTILHIITDLPVGGTQTILESVASSAKEYGFESLVVSLRSVGPVGEALVNLHGIPVLPMGMHPSMPNPRVISRIAALIRHHRPAIVQTWMYHADLIGGIACRLARRRPLVWNIRQSPVFEKRSTRWVARVCAGLSFVLPDRIVCGSQAALEGHLSLGYNSRAMQVIANGTDLDRFQGQAVSEIRHKLGLSSTTRTIGCPARWDSLKDHACFARAAARLVQHRKDVRFIMCGEGMTEENNALSSLLRTHNIEPFVHLLGRRTDMPAVYSAFDIATLSSRAEGFPNVLVEAMSCGVPCVATAAGDSASIVGDTGYVVPVGDDHALMEAWERALSLPSERYADLRLRARRRAEQHYDHRKMIANYYRLYDDLIAP